MLRIYSPSTCEQAVADFLQREVRRLGFRVSCDKVGNVIGEIGRGSPTILLCGHMDTVPGEIPLTYKGGALYGRGAVDAKAPLASMIIAAHELSGSLDARVIVAAVVDEEGEGKGIKGLLHRNLSPDYAVFGEPSGSDNIVIGYKGSLTLHTACSTITGHSAAPWLYKNAIEKTYEIWRLISSLKHPREKEDSYFYSITKCLTKLEGGSPYNIVPEHCQAIVDLRIPPQIQPRDVLQQLKEGLKAWRSQNRDVKLRLSYGNGLRGYEADTDSLLVNAFSIAIRKIKRKRASLIKKTGSSDMNVMAERTSIPMIAFGPGDSKLDHAPNEHILIEEYLDGIAVLKEGLLRLKDLHVKARS